MPQEISSLCCVIENGAIKSALLRYAEQETFGASCRFTAVGSDGFTLGIALLLPPSEVESAGIKPRNICNL